MNAQEFHCSKGPYNEKYIAFTRALMQLNIVQTVESISNHGSKIIQGDEIAE